MPRTTTGRKPDAAKRFDENYLLTAASVNRLLLAMERFRMRQKKRPADWGYVGTLGHVNAEICNLIDELDDATTTTQRKGRRK